ncbi:sigma-70 family RNA polymerase sigma factor [Rhizobium wenxiniae]|uniref:sigma-70 family RNA polymerase sigma factor n=1 Tax=Rhizobium wenxiniae TaxID=1737357 RepID=UPI003C13E95D
MTKDDPDCFDRDLIELIPALHRFARRFYSHPNDIDDLVQDTVVKAISNREKFQAGTNLKSWLFTIMRNAFCTKFATAKREHVGVDDAVSKRSVVQPTQEWSLRGQELEAAIANLPDAYRQAIDVVFIQGVSYEDAARQFGCAVGTVKSRVNRAREKISNLLGE